MKIRKLLLNAAWALPLLLCCACVNNDYDLSDIDTTTRIRVDNLVVPLNLDPIQLETMLDINDGDRIEKVTINGETVYGVVEKGEFNSGEVNIKEVVIAKPVLPQISDKLNVNLSDKLKDVPSTYDGMTFSAAKTALANLGITDDTQLVHFAISNVHKELSFKANNLDKAIEKVGHLGVETEFSVTVDFPGAEKLATSYHINNLKIQLPKGLETSNKNYDKSTGVLAIDAIDAGSDLKVTISLPLTGIDPDVAGAVFKDHNFSFSQNVSAEGEINIYLKDINENATVGDLRNFSQIGYTCDANFLEDITVKAFSGDIRYEVAKPTISPVNLNNLPEVLTQTGTRIDIANPQIYISVNNPIDAKFQIKPSVGLTLTPNVANPSGPFAKTIELKNAKTVLCMSPLQPSGYFKDSESQTYDYSSAEFSQFANLGHILACQGADGYQMPNSISIDVAPVVDQSVTDFELKNYGKVTGNYAFFAPLSLTSESVICYDKTWNDWDDESLDKLTITSATITATVDSDIPASITSETVAYLLGRDQNGNTVRMKGTASLPANAQNYQLEIKLEESTGISRIYGMELKIRATGGDDVLTPTQKITVKDVKATVSGYYQDEL